MPILPIHTATDGLIRIVAPKIDSLVIGTRGLLWDYDDTPAPPPAPSPKIKLPGGGSKYRGKLSKDIKLEQHLKDIKIREDEEILIIIKALIQCQ